LTTAIWTVLLLSQNRQIAGKHIPRTNALIEQFCFLWKLRIYLNCFILIGLRYFHVILTHNKSFYSAPLTYFYCFSIAVNLSITKIQLFHGSLRKSNCGHEVKGWLLNCCPKSKTFKMSFSRPRVEFLGENHDPWTWGMIVYWLHHGQPGVRRRTHHMSMGVLYSVDPSSTSGGRYLQHAIQHRNGEKWKHWASFSMSLPFLLCLMFNTSRFVCLLLCCVCFCKGHFVLVHLKLTLSALSATVFLWTSLLFILELFYQIFNRNHYNVLYQS